MDRVDQIAPLRLLGKARAGAEREQLRGLDARQAVTEQNEACLRVLHAELAHSA